MAANALLGFAAVISSQPRHEGEGEEAAGDAWVGLEVGGWGQVKHCTNLLQSGEVGSREIP